MFTFKLELASGEPAEPPRLVTAVPNWRAGDAIPLTAERGYRVLEVRVTEEGQVLVVEPA